MAGGGEFAHIGRLKEEEEKALLETQDKLQQWHKFDKDYTALKSRLTTLPDKVSHEVMVPFGKLAFMPGQLVHTNEILVLLGDNWFAERSAKQACQIIDRRKAYVQKMMDDLKKQQYLLESRLGFVSDMKQTVEGKGDLVEIREEYDEEKEKKWKEERRAKKKEPPASKTSPDKPSPSDKDASSIHDDKSEQGKPTAEELLWARLDELERQEEELDELEMTDDDNDEEDDDEEDEEEEEEEDINHQNPEASSLHDAHKHVHWQDQDQELSSSLALDLHQQDEEEEKSMSVIHFSHTRVSEEKNSSEEHDRKTSPRSPADIYELYQARSRDESEGSTAPLEGHPKSILRHSDVQQPINSPAIRQPEERRQPLPAPVSAFTGSIVEHSHPSQPTIPEPSGEGSKRMSKFKAARQGRR